MADLKNDEKIQGADQTIEEYNKNPWRNVYWFARMLIDGDKYGAIGKESTFLSKVCSELQQIIEIKTQTDEVKLTLCKDLIKRLFGTRFAKKTERTERINLFLDDLVIKLENISDVKVFILTAQHILIPINLAMQSIPNDDRAYSEEIARDYLNARGESALSTVIKLWDDAGVTGCLNAERILVVQGFTRLRQHVCQMPEYEANMVLTAYVQEFERRLAQKRKGRGGGSLEDVVDFLLDYFKIKAAKKPEHFQTDIEIDKWIRRKDTWLIGISCKRTLRERWKQVASANQVELSNHLIWEVWHLITYDKDLSDDKLSSLGGKRHVFYLPDNSRRLKRARNHLGLKNYVRPMSQFISDIRSQQKHD